MFTKTGILAAVMLVLSGAAAAAEPPPELTAQIHDAARTFQKVHPQMTFDAAVAAFLGQDRRKAIVTELIARPDDSFGGAWYDPPSDTLHITVTNTKAHSHAGRLAGRLGVRLALHRAQRSFTALERLANAIREGELGRASGRRVGIDVTTNQVTVAVPAPMLRRLSAPPGVKLTLDPGFTVRKESCWSRRFCDDSVQAGLLIWSGDPSWDDCSAGFTANQLGGFRILYTAGHCYDAKDPHWYTFDESIGPMINSVQTDPVDAAIILILGPKFYRQRPGADIYDTNGGPVPVNDYARSLASMLPGELVCLSANAANPAGPHRCGLLRQVSDPYTGGYVTVSGVQSYDGDSGGGWYLLTSLLKRHAYGIHGGRTYADLRYFSAMPTVTATLGPFYVIETRLS